MKTVTCVFRKETGMVKRVFDEAAMWITGEEIDSDVMDHNIVFGRDDVESAIEFHQSDADDEDGDTSRPLRTFLGFRLWFKNHPNIDFIII